MGIEGSWLSNIIVAVVRTWCFVIFWLLRCMVGNVDCNGVFQRSLLSVFDLLSERLVALSISNFNKIYFIILAQSQNLWDLGFLT